ncbi:MAG: M23 family metallopeptidase [Myxococcales bacterium]|nr:M23 family metallopeptidase [Myxococcales bacterium]
MRRVAALALLAACGTGASFDDEGADAAPPMTDTGTGADLPAPTTGPDEPDPAASSDGGALTGAISEPWMGGTGGDTTGGDDTTTGGDDPLADCPRLRIDVPAGEVLNVRPDPSTAMAPIGELADGALVDAVAAVQGEVIDGNGLWYQMSSPGLDGFVFSGFVACTLDEHPPPPMGYFLPFACGKQVHVSQGNDGDVSHQGKDLYAFDFAVGLDTPLLAMADGVVQHVYDLTKPGDPCYDGGGPECSAHGNLVVVLHGDDTSTYYKHLNEIHVVVGQEVARMAQLGLSGTTGYSTGPHAHIMRQDNCGAPKCQSIPLEFAEAGVPVTGQDVVSMNCP